MEEKSMQQAMRAAAQAASTQGVRYAVWHMRLGPDEHYKIVPENYYPRYEADEQSRCVALADPDQSTWTRFVPAESGPPYGST